MEAGVWYVLRPVRMLLLPRVRCPIKARAGSVLPESNGHKKKTVSNGPSQPPAATITHQEHILQQNCLDFHP